VTGNSAGEAAIRFRDTSSGTTLDVHVTVVLPTPPVISLSITSVTLAATAGGVSPAPVSVLVRNDGGGVLSWFVREDASWLTASPSNGVGGGHFVLTANTATLAAGTYEAVVDVAAPGASSRAVHLTLVVDSANLDFAGSYDAEAVVQEHRCSPSFGTPPPPVGRRRSLQLAVTGTVPGIQISADGVVMGGTIRADGSFEVRHVQPASGPFGGPVTTLTGTIQLTESPRISRRSCSTPAHF
jgi:hypothetical protein